MRNNTNIAIQASGGVRSVDDIEKVKKIGIEYVILGRSIHNKIIALEDAMVLEDR